MDLLLSLEECSGFTWIGISGRKLDPLYPRDYQEIEFTIVPLFPGLHSISGIRLLDTFLKRTYTFDDIGQVFVITGR